MHDDSELSDDIKSFLYDTTVNKKGFDGIALSTEKVNLEDKVSEIRPASLSEISLAVMKHYSRRAQGMVL